jgi:rubrerythrin
MRKPKHSSGKGLGAAALEEFMKQAYAMELEAAERYADFATQMEVHNNSEVAALFRNLSEIEHKHALRIRKQMGWKASPQALTAWRWLGTEGPETGAPGDLHYLMQPYHALEIALTNEQRAARFFAGYARKRLPAAIRRAASEMAREERLHVRLVQQWLARVPKPEAGWDRDPDPPNPDGE